MSHIPSLVKGCRLSEFDGEAMLLMPERALKLSGPGPEILRLVDGERSVEEIVDELKAKFGASEDEPIASETAAFLDKLAEIRAIEYVAST